MTFQEGDKVRVEITQGSLQLERPKNKALIPNMTDIGLYNGIVIEKLDKGFFIVQIIKDYYLTVHQTEMMTQTEQIEKIKQEIEGE